MKLTKMKLINFAKYFSRLMKHEGGYVNHPKDPGGETNWGVTKRVARCYGYKGSMKKLPKATAEDISKRYYWDKVRGDSFHPAIAYQVFDAAYNHGTANAIRFLQRAVGVSDDGKIGRITLSAVNKRDPNDVVLLFNAERLYFYTKLSTWKSFSRGWTRRIVANLRHAAEDNPIPLLEPPEPNICIVDKGVKVVDDEAHSSTPTY